MYIIIRFHIDGKSPALQLYKLLQCDRFYRLPPFKKPLNKMSSQNHRESVDAYLRDHRHQSRFTLVGPLSGKQQLFDDPVIFVDGGSIWREGGEGICVGDGDSSEVPMDLTLDSQKDFSDLSFALGLLPEQASEIILDGFLGGRRDHELFNFGEVFHFLKNRSTPNTVQFDQEVLAVGRGHWHLEISGLFSLMTIETTEVALTGACHYQIDPPRQVAPLSSFGLSNIAEGKISIQASNPIFVLSENIQNVQPVTRSGP